MTTLGTRLRIQTQHVPGRLAARTAKLPLQVVLRNILTAGMIEDTEAIPLDQLLPAQSLKTKMIVVTLTPILCVYPFIQRYFVKGVMIGSIKG